MTTLAATDENIALAGQRLREGLLVAMPTETVYGLGADALNDAACKRIFEVKGRPPTDPLIVHITDVALMETLWETDPATLVVARALGAALWPGPLTMVAKASGVVPASVTGGSGFVGLRVPSHAVARQLIDASGCCIAAPSANTFGHVSPTTAAHVADDLASRDATLTILDGGSCTVGVESTVVKLTSPNHIELLRRGFVSGAVIEAALAAAGLDVTVTVRDTRTKHASESQAMDGPGQLLTHYSPCVPSFLVTKADADDLSARLVAGWSVDLNGTQVDAKDCIVLDFRGSLAVLASRSLASRTLSNSGIPEEACQQVFDALRWTETVTGAKVVLFPLVSEFATDDLRSSEQALALLDAVEDRLFRAASGRIARLQLTQ